MTTRTLAVGQLVRIVVGPFAGKTVRVAGIREGDDRGVLAWVRSEPLPVDELLRPVDDLFYPDEIEPVEDGQ